MKKINFLHQRNKVLEIIKNKYIDIPNLFHETNGDGTNKDMFIDEICVCMLDLLEETIQLTPNFNKLRKTCNLCGYRIYSVCKMKCHCDLLNEGKISKRQYNDWTKDYRERLEGKKDE